MRRLPIENSCISARTLVDLYNNGELVHNKNSLLKTSAKYLKAIFEEVPTPSIHFECVMGESNICIKEHSFLATLVAYCNGAKYKGIPKYRDLSDNERRIFDATLVNVWKTRYIKEAQDA